MILQKRAIRIINGKNYNSHTDPLFKKSGILKIDDQFEFEVLLFIYDYLNNKLPSSFQGKFKYNHEMRASYQTRQSNLLYIPLSKSIFTSRLPVVTYPRIWNTYYCPTSETTSRAMLKKYYKSLLLSKYQAVIVCLNSLCRDCFPNSSL